MASSEKVEIEIEAKKEDQMQIKSCRTHNSKIIKIAGIKGL